MRRDMTESSGLRWGFRVLGVRLRRVLVLPSVLALLSSALFASPAIAGQTYISTASWLGYTYSLTLVANVTVASYPDARLVGQVTNFQTTSRKESCLNGLSINVYTAPAEFPGAYVVNDDSQGTMCALGTWTFPIYTYTATWLGYASSSLKLIANPCVECFPDSTLVGKVASFQTQDAHFSCLDGQNLNVYTAAGEFPGLYLVHVAAGSMCTPTAETWTFPIYTYTGSWNGAGYQLTLLPNNEIQTAPDASLIAYHNNCNGSGQPACGAPVQLQNLQTGDPNFACLKGSSINVWMAQNEFPGKHVAHVAGATMCTGFGATWTFTPVSHYTITLKSYIPQAQTWDPDTSVICSLLLYGSFTALTINSCPYLTYSAENTVFGTSSNDPGVPGCYTPFDPFNTTVSGVFIGDNHSGYDGTSRTQTVVDFDWNPASRTISNFTTTSETHGKSTVTLTYTWWFFGIPSTVAQCSVSDTRGLQYPPSSASGASFTTGTSGWDPFIPGETNSFLCNLFPFCGPYGDVIDATLNGSFNTDGTLTLPWKTDWYPSYGIQVWANSSYDAPQYQSTVLDESWVPTMSLGGISYVGFGLKYYNALTYACTPAPDPTGLLFTNNCNTGSTTLNPAP